VNLPQVWNLRKGARRDLKPRGDIRPHFRHIQSFRELAHPGPDPLAVQVGVGLDNGLNIEEVLGAMSDRLEDDQVLWGGKPDGESARVVQYAPLYGLSFERQHAQRDVHGDAAFQVAKEQNVVLTGKGLAIWDTHDYALSRGSFDQGWQLIAGDQNDGVYIDGQPRSAQQAGGYPANDHPLIVETTQQALHSLEWLYQGRSTGAQHIRLLRRAQRS
jgi:hypothetical protein